MAKELWEKAISIKIEENNLIEEKIKYNYYILKDWIKSDNFKIAKDLLDIAKEVIILDRYHRYYLCRDGFKPKYYFFEDTHIKNIAEFYIRQYYDEKEHNIVNFLESKIDKIALDIINKGKENV
jgi:hypothetical protein